MSSILFAARQSWTTLRMSRPLFVGSYLHVTWWVIISDLSYGMRCASLFLVKPICEKVKALKGLFIVGSALSLSSYLPSSPTKEGLILRSADGRQPVDYLNARQSI